MGLSNGGGPGGIKGGDIASAGTTNLAAATGDFVDVTGTTTITGLGTAAAGVERVVRFTGALTITHNATSLILPGGMNIVTVAGDVLTFRSLGSGNWVCVGYTGPDGVTRRSASLFQVCYPGGTTTQRITLRHDGTDGYIAAESGQLFVGAASGQLIHLWNGGYQTVSCGPILTYSGSPYSQWTGTGAQLCSGATVTWSASTTQPGTPDTGLARAAEKVIGLTDGSTAGGTLASVPLSPTQITGSVNDYAPGTARTLRLSADAARNVTGLAAGVNGQEVRLANVGAQTITLKNQDAASSAANRFLFSTGADIALLANQSLWIWYDGTTGRWREDL